MYAHLQVTANYCNVAGTEAKGENCILAVGAGKSKHYLNADWLRKGKCKDGKCTREMSLGQLQR